MVSENLRGLSFRTSAGETVRVHDCICWRHLECRPCRTAQECQVAQAVDVVIIPVAPSGYGNSKRARKTGSPPVHTAAAGVNASTSDSASNPAPTHISSSAKRVVDVTEPGGRSPAIERDGLLDCCAAAQAALEASGLRAAVDDCPRQTPGAKYHAWENRGVGLRIEVGSREAASGTFCLALHPRLAHLMPLATAAVAAADAAGQSNCAGVQGGSVAAATAAGARAGGRANLRLGGLSPEQLVVACRAVVAETRQDPTPTGGSSSGSAAGAAAATGAPAEAPEATGSSRWCGKLHLWPELVAAWGSTEAAVAALLEELAAAAAAAQTGGGGGAATSSRGAGGGASSRPLCQRPCFAHLRHLLQLGRPCYCGRGHFSLQQLQQEVERRFQEGSGGVRGQSGQQHQPMAVVVGWIAPPQPKTWQSRQQQQQQELAQCAEVRGGARAAPRAGATWKATATADDLVDMDDGQGNLDGRSATDGGDSVGGGDGGRVVLLVGNIPSAVRAGVVQGELAEAFEPYGCCGVAVSRTRSGGVHGWARVSLAGPTAEATTAAAAEAVAALDGKLRLGGAPLTVSYSSGRLDTIFPYLPYVVRSALRVDSTAAFSATDQATADKMTDLLAGLAEALMIERQPQQPQQLVAPLLPLVVTDGTACCGGNALSFARRFERTVAVELDPERAEDLRHNAALVSAWDAFRRSTGTQEQQPMPTPSSGQPIPPPPASRPTTAGAGAGASTVKGGRASGVGGREQEGGLGSLEVACGDYTRLMSSLRQDVVFVDPPWGGPQYCGATGAPAGRPARGSPAGAAAAARSGGGGVGGSAAMDYGDAAFMLGQQPVSYMVSELLAGGQAGMVALKLPSRADAELRAMQARVRQLVAARLRELAKGTGAGGGGDGHACRPKLLCAEVTLGRSALVVFMLLPYKFGGRTSSAGGMPPACSDGGGRLCNAGLDDGGTAAVVAAGSAGGGGGTCSAGHADGGRVAQLPPADLSDEEEEEEEGAEEAEDEGEEEEGEDNETDGDEEGGHAGVDGRGSGRARPGARRHSATAGGCRACAGLGAAFRAALRDRCSRLGLPYRLVCE